MIEKIQIGISFVAMIIDLAWVIALAIGVEFQINNPDCKDEVKLITGHRKAVKVIALINLVCFAIVFILFNIKN